MKIKRWLQRRSFREFCKVEGISEQEGVRRIQAWRKDAVAYEERLSKKEKER